MILEDHLISREYKPKTQECLASRIDVQEAKRRNHSLQVFLDSIGG